MNVYWNLANFGIALSGYWGSRKRTGEQPDFQTTLERQHSAEKIYLFNGGLDVDYIMGGLYLTQLAGRLDGEWAQALRGFGYSIVAQGGFLLAFDAVMYWLHRQHATRKWPVLFEHIEFTSQGIGIAVPLH